MCPPFTPFPFRAAPGAGTETGIDNNINSWPQITKHLIFTQDILRKLSDFFFGTGRVVNSGSCRKQKGIGCISLSLYGFYSHFSRKGPERPPEPKRGVLPPWETSDKVHSCDLLYRASEQIWGWRWEHQQPWVAHSSQLEQQTYPWVSLFPLTLLLISSTTCPP